MYKEILKIIKMEEREVAGVEQNEADEASLRPSARLQNGVPPSIKQPQIAEDTISAAIGVFIPFSIFDIKLNFS